MFIVLRTIIANFLFQTIGSLPAEGPGSEGIQGRAIFQRVGPRAPAPMPPGLGIPQFRVTVACSRVPLARLRGTR